MPLLSSLIISGMMLAGLYLGAFPGGFPRSVLVVEAVIGLASVVFTRLVAALPYLKGSGVTKRIAWQEVLNRLMIYSLPVGLTLLIYIGLNQAYFHTYIPVSGQIKRWWGTLPNTVYGQPVHNLAGMLGFDLGSQGPWTMVTDVLKSAQPADWIILLILAVVTTISFILNKRRLVLIVDQLAIFPLLAGGMVQLSSYTGTGYLHMRDWYWTSQFLVITLSLGVIVDSITSSLISHSMGLNVLLRRILYGTLFFAGGLIFIISQADIIHRFPTNLSPRMVNSYLEPIRELEADTEPGAIIGSTGGGVIAYFVQNRTIINLDGLMNTAEYFDMLQKGDACNYLDQIGLQYIYAKELVITDSDPYFQFKDRLNKIKSFGGSTLYYWASGR